MFRAFISLFSKDTFWSKTKHKHKENIYLALVVYIHVYTFCESQTFISNYLLYYSTDFSNSIHCKFMNCTNMVLLQNTLSQRQHHHISRLPNQKSSSHPWHLYNLLSLGHNSSLNYKSCLLLRGRRRRMKVLGRKSEPFLKVVFCD